jgi:hypothetical protein
MLSGVWRSRPRVYWKRVSLTIFGETIWELLSCSDWVVVEPVKAWLASDSCPMPPFFWSE